MLLTTVSRRKLCDICFGLVPLLLNVGTWCALEDKSMFQFWKLVLTSGRNDMYLFSWKSLSLHLGLFGSPGIISFSKPSPPTFRDGKPLSWKNSTCSDLGLRGNMLVPIVPGWIIWPCNFGFFRFFALFS